MNSVPIACPHCRGLVRIRIDGVEVVEVPVVIDRYSGNPTPPYAYLPREVLEKAGDDPAMRDLGEKP